MSQGWDVDNVAGTITFLEPPAALAAIAVTESAAGSVGATDVWAYPAWGTRWGWPGKVEFFGDRLSFARSPTRPQTLWMSQPGDYTNFGKSVPGIDSDVIVDTLNTRKVNSIQELVPLTSLVILTTGGIWLAQGNTNGVLTPSQTSFVPQNYFGAANLPAILVGESALFAQHRGYSIRDIAFDWQTNGYTGNDLSIFSQHLIRGHTISMWAWQAVPFSCAWIVRDDGVALTMTYQREQQVVGWARHGTDGIIEDVCVVPEGNEDVVYLGILRQGITGGDRRYIERMSTRRFLSQRDWFFVDSGLTFDGRNTGPTTMDVTVGTGWGTDNTVNIASSTDQFVGDSDLGDWIVLDYDNPDVTQMVRLSIIEVVDARHVIARPLVAVPVAWQGVATTNWAWARGTMSGLDHLNGKNVVALADANVMGSRLVTDGTITLDNPATIVHAGLSYYCQMETLGVNVVGAPTVRAKTKNFTKVSILVHEGRDLKVGPSEGPLDTYPARDTGDGYLAPAASLTDELAEVYIEGDWVKDGGIMIRHDDPLALAITAIIPEVEFGES